MRAQTDTLARIYAQSLFDLSEAAGGREKILEVADELEQICELIREDASFREYLTSPVIDPARRSLGIRNMFSSRITDLVLRFLLVLNNNGRLGHFEPITAGFDELVQDAWGRVEVDVWTAAPLQDDVRQELHTRLHDILGKEPVIHPWLDEAMIGGIRIRVGDRMIDGSVAAKLRQIESQLRQQGSRRVTDSPEDFLSVPTEEQRFE